MKKAMKEGLEETPWTNHLSALTIPVIQNWAFDHIRLPNISLESSAYHWKRIFPNENAMFS
jgi:hypothetical protein